MDIFGYLNYVFGYLYGYIRQMKLCLDTTYGCILRNLNIYVLDLNL